MKKLSILIIVIALLIVSTMPTFASQIKFDSDFHGTFGKQTQVGLFPAFRITCESDCTITTMNMVNGKIQKLILPATVVSENSLSFTNLSKTITTWQFEHIDGDNYQLTVTKNNTVTVQDIVKMKK